MERYLQILRISWLSTLIVTILASLLTLLIPIVLKNNSYSSQSNFSWWITITILTIAVLVLFAGKYEKRQIKKLKKQELLTKIVKYKTIYTNQMLCYMMISIVCFIIMLLSKQIGVIIFDIFAILLIITHRPTSIKVKFDLNLTAEELEKFNYIKFETKYQKK